MDYLTISKRYIYVLIFIFNIGCSNNNNSNNKHNKINTINLEYQYIRYDTNEDVNIYNFPVIDYSVLKKDSLYNLRYIIDKSSYFYNQGYDTIIYFLHTTTKPQSSVVVNYSSPVNITLVANKQYTINQQKYNVYKFKTEEENLIDIGVEYIWVPDFGIIHTKSINWLHIFKLNFLSNNKDTENLSLLLELIYNDIDNTFSSVPSITQNK